MPFFHRTSRLPRQEHAIGDDLWVSRIRLLEHGVRGRLYPGARETLEVLLADHLHSVGCDRMQRNFEPMRKQVEHGREANLPMSLPR